MKRLLSALAAILVTSLAAYAASLPLFNTTPFYMVSAGATWTNSSTTITLASTTPCPAALQAGSAVTDTSSSQAYIIGRAELPRGHDDADSRQRGAVRLGLLRGRAE